MTLVLQGYFLVLALLLCDSRKDGPWTRRNVEVFDSDGAVIAGTVLHAFHQALCLPR